jgi:cytidyltransferase-like protein
MKVLAFGTFDILHKGHIHFLNESKDLGDELVVVIARDKTVLEVKGHTPKNDEETRKEEVIKQYIANQVLLGNESEDKYKIIEEIKPDIIAIGYDQNSYTKNLQDELLIRNIKAKIIRLTSFMPETYKTSILVKSYHT